ncbi:sialate O-acetylesterase [Mesonia aestuariivivens]|uniref:Sialate O-acetylesterase n=1 Tax=Mesonia aestuariivivens TaxID=2796128 RepID=A0ABS6W437_9FLAO|nr:sialate O-acetylesterase [Mesonia aestuariivivens]MBW2962620.1 sialate O-acetylesterase [Mesonia aestuariivivens]
MVSFQKYCFFFFFALSVHFSVQAQIKLPSLVGDHMVLQQDTEVKLWGWASSNENINITADWLSKPITISSDEDGNWKTTIKTPEADHQPHQITLEGKNKIEINDILFGEVWLCSGQSNMYFPVGKKEDTWKTGVTNYQEEVNNADQPQIRLFTVGLAASQTPLKDVKGTWQIGSPETVYNFSAVAYFFGKNLYENLNVPIGLISSSWGGTRAEAWTSQEVLEDTPDYLPILERFTEKQISYYKKLQHYYQEKEKAQRDSSKLTLDKPTYGELNKDPYVLYNAMLHPLINYTIKGVTWYQGESNAQRAYQYRTLFPDMIQNWREDWQQENLPLYFVQITPHHSQNPEIREAQLMAYRSVDHTGMVVTTDIGNPKNIHPENKQEVGRRLALWARSNTYGEKNIEYSGPMYKDFNVKRNKIQIYFDFAENGLQKKGKQLTHFEIAGEDQKFYPAKARIKGNTVIVSSAKVKKPVAVRFGWSKSPEPNLFNTAGLPASPFRTDNWPGETHQKF